MADENPNVAKCKTCGGKVARSAPTCPHCGEVDPAGSNAAQDRVAGSGASLHDSETSAVIEAPRGKSTTKKFLDVITVVVGVLMIIMGLALTAGDPSTRYVGIFNMAFGVLILPKIRDAITPRLGWKSYSMKGVAIVFVVYIVGVLAGGITDSVIQAKKEQAEAEAVAEAKAAAEARRQAKIKMWLESGDVWIKEANEALRNGEYGQANQLIKDYGDVAGDKLDPLEKRAKEVEVEVLAENARKIPSSNYPEKIKAYERLVQLSPSDVQFKTQLQKYRDLQKAAQAKAAEEKRQREISELLAKASSLPVKPYEPNLELYEKLSSLDPSNPTYKTRVANYKAKIERQRKVENLFSPWDGSYPPLKDYVKKNMNDPGSFDHVETRFADREDHIIIIMKFRGKNAFGGTILNQVTAKVELEGNNQTYTILSWD